MKILRSRKNFKSVLEKNKCLPNSAAGNSACLLGGKLWREMKILRSRKNFQSVCVSLVNKSVMPSNYSFNIPNPSFASLGYLIAVANLNEKHDRSAPSDHHWKILKCRMIIFSNSSILACPDKNEVKRIHIVFNQVGDDYDKLNSLFQRFSLSQEGEIQGVNCETFQQCFQYTMLAKIAPTWCSLGSCYLVNNRDFLTAVGPQDGVQYTITCNEIETVLNLRPVKINFIRTKDKYLPGEWIRVLPSLNKAVIEEHCESMPESARFKVYKDLRRHWKNIHGYRLPEEEKSYYLIRFWRGEPLTYPEVCVTRNFPIVTPIPKDAGVTVLSRFLSILKSKLSHVLGAPLRLQQQQALGDEQRTPMAAHGSQQNFYDTQAISLCTPTQYLGN